MRILTILLFLFTSSFCVAQTYSTVNDGDWASASTWSGGTVPDYSINNWWPETERNANIINNVTLGSGSEGINFDGYWHEINISNGVTFTVNVDSLVLNDNGPVGTTNITVENGTLIIYGDLYLINKAQLNVSGSGSVVINGNVYADGSGGYINIDEGGDLDINGTLTLQGSNSALNNSGNVEADNIIVTGGDTQLNSSATLTVINDLTVTGSGSMDIQGGQVSVGGDFTNDGSASTTVDGYLEVAGDIYNNSSISGTGGIGWEGDFIPGGGSSVENVPTAATVPPYNPYNLATGGEYNSALPVTLVHFQGIQVNDATQLSWATSEEENFDYFTIERSRGGLEFESIGKVFGAGTNTKERRDYKFNDTNPFSGTSYYRLKATDYDGSIEYFKVIYINFVPQNSTATIYPNPGAGEFLNINLSDFEITNTRLQLFNLSGALLYHKELSFPTNRIEFETQLESGVYLVVINTASESKSFKWVVK